MQAATANLIPRLRICYARGGLLPHRGTPPFLCGPAILLALLLSILFAFPAGGQAPPDEEVKPIPLLTGSTGFITTFDGGEPHLHPIVTPLVLVPIGGRWIFETRATFETDMVQLPGRSGFHGTVAKEVEYVQLDFIANPYMTVTVVRFLTPFGIFNERLYPVWIRNLQSDPLILPIGISAQQCQHWSDVARRLQGGPEVQHQLRGLFFSSLDRESRELRSIRGRTPGNLCSRSTSGNRRIFSAWAPGRAVECFWLPCLVATTNPAARHPIRICSFHRGKRPIV